MKWYGLIAASVAAILLLSFFAFSAMPIPVVQDPMAIAESLPKTLLAVFSVGLLVSDVLLPVPSSIVMFANGVAFGFLPGTSRQTCEQPAFSSGSDEGIRRQDQIRL
jgi:hypothetical protein